MPRSDPDFMAATVSGGSIPAPVLLVCEHASNQFPETFGDLGLDEDVRRSHIAWDPGAYEVAIRLSERLAATLVAGGVSRLLYDCNRPPELGSAVPERSEIYEIPGNKGLSAEERERRVELIYRPFSQAITDAIEHTSPQALVTVHSFTPVFHGKMRSVEIGILHDADTRLADACLEFADEIPFRLARNEPYGPKDGVAHTLQVHGIQRGLLNLMIEIRNDLITSAEEYEKMAHLLGMMLERALAACGVTLSDGNQRGADPCLAS